MPDTIHMNVYILTLDGVTKYVHFELKFPSLSIAKYMALFKPKSLKN